MLIFESHAQHIKYDELGMRFKKHFSNNWQPWQYSHYFFKW